MAEVKKKRIKKLSDYEETLIWMSYRYAIGRHTIASCTHAGDIAKNSYDRLLLTPSRMQFMSMDINDDILHHLEWAPYNFTIDRSSGFSQEEIEPLNLFYQFINTLNIKNFNELNNIKRVETFKTNGNISFNVIYNEEGKESGYISSMDIDDLEPWQKLSSIFNLKNHKFCKTMYNGEENIIEYVDVWHRKHGEDGYPSEVIQYEKVKMPIDSYLDNPSVLTSINEEYIVEDNLNTNN